MEQNESDRTFYSVLDVPESATPDEIREAYLLLVRAWHPDHHQSSVLGKTDIASTQTEMKRISGDLGVASSYVATNPAELAQLKHRGDRNITEFRISKAKDFKAVGDIGIQLKNVYQKQNRFTLDIRVDDKRTEKKDRHVNEPLQFYVANSLYEVVVNSVGIDAISGYVSAPASVVSARLGGIDAQAGNRELGATRSGTDTGGADSTGNNSSRPAVKTDLGATRQADPSPVRGDLGSTSSLVATNDRELDELIKRGERNIVKFNISKKTKGYQKVGDISLMLKNVDPKKNKFTLEVSADDKLTEKRDRNINEPLQFYVSRSLYELVVNTVGSDTISGYLSTPKYQARKE